MTIQDKNLIYQTTGARVFYDRGRRAWCALWLGEGCENKLYFGRSYKAGEVIAAIERKKQEKKNA